MALFEHPDAFVALSRLLDTERRATLAGDFAALQSILAEKERLVSTLKSRNPDQRKLTSIREKSKYNSALLKVAAEGIDSAARRVARHRSVKSQLRTYEKSGRTETLADPKTTVERRA